jgi:glycosyltransferase involved in cell wall biosynthesis
LSAGATLVAAPVPPECAQAAAGPVIVTWRAPVFNRSEGFIQAQATGLTRYQPLVCGRNFVGNLAPQLERRVIIPRGWLARLRLDTFGPDAEYVERIAQYRPALIHAHFANDSMAALMLARRLGIPLVTSLRGYDITRSRISMLLSGSASKARYALFGAALRRRGALFLPVCDYLRERALAQGFPPDRTITHYNGVDLATFRPGDEPPEPNLVLHVGRLTEKKGGAVLLRSLARLRAEQIPTRLVVIGDGELRGKLVRQAEQLGLAGSIEWLGARPKSEVARWMRRAWVLAAPSLRGRGGNEEGLPNVVVEAAASGLPVVASRHAGIPEAIRHGRNGLLAPEGEAEPLTQALREALQSPRLREEFGIEARRIAEERFDYRRKMEELQDHYDRMIERNG